MKSQDRFKVGDRVKVVRPGVDTHSGISWLKRYNSNDYVTNDFTVERLTLGNMDAIIVCCGVVVSAECFDHITPKINWSDLNKEFSS